MTVQSTAQVGQVIRNAIAFNIRNWSGDAVNSDSLIQAVQDFFAVLAERQIDYVLVGGIAMLHYIEGRNTQDLDLLMARPALAQLPELKIASQDNYFVRAHYHALQIDILLTQHPLFKKVHQHYAQTQNFRERPIPLATVEGLLLLKLYALPSLYRQGNFTRVSLYENDIVNLLHYYQPALPSLLTELAAHVNATDLAEIQNILADLQNRLQRFRRAMG